MRNTLTIVALTAAVATVSAQARIPAQGIAAMDNTGRFELYNFDRHAVGDNDILIEILYAGICHSDIHSIHEDWGKANFPFVSGHEIAGRVAQVGRNVTKFKVGDLAGVGCMVNSCGNCEACKAHEEEYCTKAVFTYDAPDHFHNNEITKGGYSNNIVVTEKFAVKIPPTADLKRVAPLLCAGVTTYSPIMRSQVKKGDQVAVAGFGGLGHLAVKYAVDLGAQVTVFDITEEKRADALKMGAVKYVNVRNANELKGMDGTFDLVLSTIPTNYDMAMYLRMTKLGGDFAIVGIPANNVQPSLSVNDLIFISRRNVYGSLIGGMKETQEMLDHSVARNIYPDVEMIPATPAAVQEAYRKVIDGQVKFRYVIDMSTLK